MEQRKFIKKICLLGDGAVGKTSLVRRYVFDLFDDRYIVSFGTKVVKKVVSIGDVSMTLTIWDILGQREHSKLHAAYYRGASGALLVCDRTRPETIESIPDWAENFQKISPKAIMCLLVNKEDLPAAVSESEVAQVAEKLSIKYLQTSAKTGLNVELAFSELSNLIVGEAT